MEYEQKFIAKLTQLAVLCGVEIGDEIFEVYDSMMARYGYEEACHAVDQFMSQNMGKWTFPTVGDLIKLITPTIDDKTHADLVSSKVFEAISKYGWNNPDRAKEFLGDLGWKLVEMNGGWQHLCQSVNSNNQTSFKAQWRGLAESLLKEKGINESKPQLEFHNKVQARLLPDMLKEMPK